MTDFQNIDTHIHGVRFRVSPHGALLVIDDGISGKSKLLLLRVELRNLIEAAQKALAIMEG
jgi:hypothetical protein